MLLIMIFIGFLALIIVLNLHVISNKSKYRKIKKDVYRSKTKKEE